MIIIWSELWTACLENGVGKPVRFFRLYKNCFRQVALEVEGIVSKKYHRITRVGTYFIGFCTPSGSLHLLSPCVPYFTSTIFPCLYFLKLSRQTCVANSSNVKNCPRRFTANLFLLQDMFTFHQARGALLGFQVHLSSLPNIHHLGLNTDENVSSLATVAQLF